MENEDEINHSIEQSSMAAEHRAEELNQCDDVAEKTTVDNVEGLKLELRGVDEGGGVEAEESKPEVEEGVGGGGGGDESGGVKAEESKPEVEEGVAGGSGGDESGEVKAEESKLELEEGVGGGSGGDESGGVKAEESKLELEEGVGGGGGGDERFSVGDGGVEVVEVEASRKEGENVDGLRLEGGDEVVGGEEKMEGVIEEEEVVKVEGDDGEKRGGEGNVEGVEGKEEVVGGGGGEEMEDSEATVDEEASPRSRVVEGEEEEVVKGGSGSGGKRRRGRTPKGSTPVKAPSKKIIGEDVCFICLDGGDLVLCDRRGCPKAYHPLCVDHDDEFFKTKGRWNCGWHICNQCGKNAHFYCNTCTFSSCKGCSKDAAFFCVKGSKGFCETCMKTVMMIENSEPVATDHASFNDKSSWEYLFKDYWIEQKEKLSISSEELAQAKNLLRDSGVTDGQQTRVELLEATNDAGTDSDYSLANIDMSDSKRKRPKRKSKPVDSDTDGSLEKVGPARRKSNRVSKSQDKEVSSESENSSGNHGTSSKRRKGARRLSKCHLKAGDTEWASKELMEFVMHMKNGDRSVLAPFDVQSLLLEYISRNKLRDPRRQSQILCDSMLQKLFGKPRVGHFEMLKLLESHFLLKEDSHAVNNQGSIVDTEISQLDADDHTDMDSGKSRGRKSRKRGEDRGQSNLDDYAAIDMHNINLIYLRRCLMESLMDDSEMFHDKVVGSFVRIRISGTNQKQDIYRLVQIIGTSKAPEPYKVGKRTTDVMLEILNLDKTEIIAIDIISNQDFTEDECKRLRQSIKCGLISRMTVGEVLDKARELQGVRVTDWLEAEILRLGHLRDRASEKGRKKELRECVEKLQLLKTPEERQRRLDQIPEVHADPKMDPSCESDDENDLHDKRQVSDMRPRDTGSVRWGRDHFSSRHGGSVSNESWSGNARPPKTWELGRNSSSKGFSNRRDDNNSPSRTSEHAWGNGVDKGTPRSNSWEKPRVVQDTSVSTRAEQSGTRLDLSISVPSESSQSLSLPAGQTDGKVDDTEKSWHYRDPTAKVQGPFSIAQLRKWSNTGYFPAELRIWKTSQTEDHSILLTEALAGRFKESRSVASALSSMDTTKLSSGRYDSSSLPSPTPSRSPAALSGKQISGSFQSTNQFQGNERLPSPTPTSPSNFSHQLKGDVVGNKHENVISSTGTSQPGSGQFLSNSGPISLQQMSSQPVAHVTNQSFIPPNAVINQTNVGSNASGNVQGFSNTGHPGTGQNPSVYTNWGPGYVARPEMVNANMTPNNALPVQVAYNQWTGAPLSNQGPPYAAGTGYPPAQGNIATNLPNMQVNTAWRSPAQTNMPWGPQQQPVNQNVGWGGPPAGAMGQPSPGAQPMAAGPATGGWTGTGPSPAVGNTNMVWVAAPGTTSTWGADQNRNSGGGQWNRQSSFGSGGQRVCKYFREHGNCRKGSSCDYMHT